MSLLGDPVFGAPPSKEPFRTPLLGARPEFQTDRLTGIWAASWKGRAMGRHRKPTRWDRIRLRMVKFRRRSILRIHGK